MRKFLPVITFFLFLNYIHAQESGEQLTPLKYNNNQYRATGKHVSHYGFGALLDKGNYVVTTDTLTLPFVDDFSTNRLRSYNWLESHVYQTYYKVYSGNNSQCLANMGVPTVIGTYIRDFAYNYSIVPVDTIILMDTVKSVINPLVDSLIIPRDSAVYEVDSTVQPLVPYIYFGSSPVDCFTQQPDTFYFSNPYYRYKFNLGNGTIIDSFLVNDSSIYSPRHIDTLYYAPVVYFSQGEPGTLWFDNYAYVNNTFPVNPPTIGVATLDGLNDFGMPYNNSSNTTYGTADYLTSKPIDLSAILNTDSTVYLSFFFEGQGLGDYPKPNDSLVVEIRDDFGNWNELWSSGGYSDPSYVPNQFQQIILQVPPLYKDTVIVRDSMMIDTLLLRGTNYFYNTFQFRFRNEATLTGSVDHWHIDYVKLDRNRNAEDTVIHDIAFVYPFPSILKNYTLLPADLFTGNADLRDSISLPVNNLNPNANTNPPATNFTTSAAEPYPNSSVVFTSPVQTFNAAQQSYIQVAPSSSYSILPNNPTWPLDSLVIISQAIIEPNDNRPTNDTITQVQNFGYLMAYDDGSAEVAYGLTGLGLKKFAYEFNISKPEPLAGFQIMFDQVSDNVNDLIFNFNLWDTLTLNNYLFADTPIVELGNMAPLYIDSVNGFATYVLDTPKIISGKWYLGWSQDDNRSLQVGYDLNSTLGRQHMYIFLNGEWDSSQISPAGSPMIRLILDSNYQGTSSPVVDLRRNKSNLTVFPNPAIDIVSLQCENANAVFDVDVYDMMGQLAQHATTIRSYMDVSALANGMYLLNARDKLTGNIYHTKLIKTGY